MNVIIYLQQNYKSNFKYLFETASTALRRVMRLVNGMIDINLNSIKIDVNF